MTTSEKGTFRVTFAGVGRSKRTWATTLQEHPTEATLERLVRKSDALMSGDIECVYDSDEEYGEILVGGYRPVGAFHAEEVSNG